LFSPTFHPTTHRHAPHATHYEIDLKDHVNISSHHVAMFEQAIVCVDKRDYFLKKQNAICQRFCSPYHASMLMATFDRFVVVVAFYEHFVMFSTLLAFHSTLITEIREKNRYKKNSKK
jgi:hypothetical protein